MSIDLMALADAVAVNGKVVRIVVAQTEGSTPREVGAAMLVWQDGQEGTIGGGALEWQAVTRARELLERNGERSFERLALGPSLGQCCGGAVTLLSEVFDAQSVRGIENNDVFARCRMGSTDQPLSVTRLLSAARSQGVMPASCMVDGWMIEPITPSPTPLWIYGAGHVGRGLVNVITSLPDFVITWIDTAPDRYPEAIPPGVTVLPAARPEAALRKAPKHAFHLILTYSHVIDLELCHAALCHGFASAGLIGSATKWARFRNRLLALGHESAEIDRITCPIGDPALGKHPHAIAVGVAATLLRQVAHIKNTNGEVPDDRKRKHRKISAVNT